MVKKKVRIQVCGKMDRAELSNKSKALRDRLFDGDHWLKTLQGLAVVDDHRGLFVEIDDIDLKWKNKELDLATAVIDALIG